jgi:hypothetical protein
MIESPQFHDPRTVPVSASTASAQATGAMMDGFDVLVVDLQDVAAASTRSSQRYATYSKRRRNTGKRFGFLTGQIRLDDRLRD